MNLSESCETQGFLPVCQFEVWFDIARSFAPDQVVCEGRVVSAKLTVDSAGNRSLPGELLP
jgi:hypothetical protein